MSDLDAFLVEVGKSQFGWPDSLRFTYDKTRELLRDGIPGDLVECGVAAGVHPAAMWRACCDEQEFGRKIHLFDSFLGVPHGRADFDVEWSEHYGDGSGRLEPTGVAACSRADVQANLLRWEGQESIGAEPPANWQYKIHEGWFQNTVAAYAEEATNGIAFLRLDGDLYDSTIVCLRALYPLCNPFAVVVLDDYNLDGARAALRDYFNEIRQLEPSLTMITASGDVWWRKP